MPLTLVTGGTGFLGRRVMQRLLAENGDVRLLTRRPGQVDPAVAKRVEVVAGNVCDGRAVERAMRNVDAVLHLAALTSIRAPHDRDYTAVNTLAVQGMLAAAAGARVRRLVHVSTWLVAPPDRPAPLNGSAARLTPYEESKQAAEIAVRAYVAAGHDAVIVRPTRVYGPGPLSDSNGATRLLDLYLAGRLHVCLADQGALANWVHVDDVAEGILLALRRGACGATYVLGGPENVDVRGFLEQAAQVAGIRPHRLLPLPPAVAVLYARVSLLLGHFDSGPAITPSWVRSFLESRTADIDPTRREIGYAPRTLREGLTETVAWLGGGRRW